MGSSVPSSLKILRRELSTPSVRGVIEFEATLDVGDEVKIANGGDVGGEDCEGDSVITITRKSVDTLHVICYTVSGDDAE